MSSRRPGPARTPSSGTGDDAPFVVTLQLDAATTDRLQAQRDALFPPALNRVPVHLTLFHALPGAEERTVIETIGRRVGTERPFPVTVTQPYLTGRGVAYRVASPPLEALRADLAAAFAPWLTGQDRQRFRPHVTVQNKVAPAGAKDTLATIAATFAPYEATAEGIQLWRYRGGPWQPAGVLRFG